MDSEVRLLLDRADNELLAAMSLKKISEQDALNNNLSIPTPTTFYSSVISHSYYAIFYANLPEPVVERQWPEFLIYMLKKAFNFSRLECWKSMFMKLPFWMLQVKPARLALSSGVRSSLCVAMPQECPNGSLSLP